MDEPRSYSRLLEYSARNAEALNELIAMLEECRDWIAEDPEADIILPKIDAVIKKAQGES